MAEDFYNILGISREASQDDIKKAYRTLSKKYHPDLNPNNNEAEEKFKKINEAYSTLSDPAKKQQYDRGGSNNFGGFNGFGSGGFDFFGDFFNINNQRRQNQNSRGADLKITLNFTLEEIINGSIKSLKYSRNVSCNSCSGNGSKNGTSLKTCSSCGGSGLVNQVIQTPFGRIQNSSVCNLCYGRGSVINEICHDCGSRGIKEKLESIELNIPPGITDGFVYKIESGGNYASTPNSIPGDLIVVCQISEHEFYKRFGLDLHRDVFISFLDAIIGTDNYVLNVFGEDIRIRIESNTENGKILRLKGMGLPNNNRKGDLYLHLNIYVPKDLNEETVNHLKIIKEQIDPQNHEINLQTGFLSKSLKINSLYNN